MKNNIIFEIVKKEIRDVLRDRKTLLSMILVPLILYPLMFGFILVMQEDMVNKEQSGYNKMGFAFETDEVMNTLIEELEIQKENGNIDELKEKLENGDIDGYITFENKNFTVYYVGESTDGFSTLQLAYTLLESYKNTIQSHMLVQEGIVPDEIFNVYTIKEEEVSGKDYFTEYIMSMVPTFIIISSVITAVMTAIDMTAGEKERGTMETLLTFPIKNGEIITGKFLATTLCTVISSVIGFISMYGTVYVLSEKLESLEGMELISLKNLIFTLIMFVMFSMLVSALSIVIASRAKSFKEAQNATQIIQLIAMAPMFLSILEVKSSVIWSLIPFFNINFLLSDVISNSLNMNHFILMILSNLIFVIVILKAIIKVYKSDKILFS